MRTAEEKRVVSSRKIMGMLFSRRPDNPGQFPPELAHVQVIIEPFLCHQFIMTAAFDNLSAVYHKDNVRVPDSREPVGDDKGRPAFL
jgi:hypothetical protein